MPFSYVMNKLSKYGRDRLIGWLATLLSISFTTSASFEKNPQDCEMVSVIKKRKRTGIQNVM